MTAIGITTAKREQNYLATTVAKIPGDLPVYIAPTFPSDPIPTRNKLENFPGWLETLAPIAQEDPGAGNRDSLRLLERNTDRLIRYLAESRSPDHPFVTMQDDVHACKNAWRRVAEVAKWMAKRRDVAWISFYSPWQEAGAWRSALWPYPASKFYGELVLLWNPKAAREYVRNADFTMAHDLDIQRYFGRDRGLWKFYAHSPCLFQHIGVESATGKDWNQGRRETMNFSDKHDAIANAKALR